MTNDDIFEESMDNFSQNVKTTVDNIKRIIRASQFATKIAKAGMVLGTFAMTNKIIDERYKPTGLYKLGKWGIAYAVAAEVAKSMSGSSEPVTKGEGDGRTADEI